MDNKSERAQELGPELRRWAGSSLGTSELGPPLEQHGALCPLSKPTRLEAALLAMLTY